MGFAALVLASTRLVLKNPGSTTETLVPKALNPRSASSDKASFPKPEEAPVMRTILSSSNQGSGFVQGPRIYALHQVLPNCAARVVSRLPSAFRSGTYLK